MGSPESRLTVDLTVNILDDQSVDLVAAINAMLARPAPPGMDPVVAARSAASEMFRAFAGPSERGEECRQEDINIVAEHHLIPARIYRPAGAGGSSALPCVMFFHGGGWAFGALDDYDGLLRALAPLSGAAIISVDYRLAPEHRFPAALEDAISATDYVARNARALGVDRTRLAVMGDSAGGNLAAIVAQTSRTRGPALAAQFLLYPMLDVGRPHSAYPSRLEFGGGEYFLLREAIDASLDFYLADRSLKDDPRISPINEMSLAGLAPAFILAPGCDPLRDEAAAYARKLQAAGVDTRYCCMPGLIHGFLSFGVLDKAQRARRDLANEMRRMLLEGPQSN